MQGIAKTSFRWPSLVLSRYELTYHKLTTHNMYQKERPSQPMPNMTIKPDPFYDRKLELAALDRAWKRHGAGGQMLLLYGRRRLGKTFLLQRYFTAGVDGDEHEKPHCYFLAEQSTAATQRLTLARQLIAALPSEGVTAEDIAVSWNALLRYASQQAKERKKGAGPLCTDPR